jgi:hypothetical protein
MRWNALGSLLLSLLPFLIWHGLHRADRGYTDALLAVYGNQGLAALKMQLSRQIPALSTALDEVFSSAYLPHAVSSLLVLACLAAAGWRLIHLKADGIYLAAYFAVVLLWPYPEVTSRLVWSVLPVMLVQVVLVARKLDTVLRVQQWLPAMLCTIWLATLGQALPAITLAAGRYMAPYKSGYAEARGLEAWYTEDLAAAVHGVNSQMTVAQALQRLPGWVPPDQCVFAVRPVIVTYFTGRRSMFPPLNSTPEPDFSRELHRHGCRYAFMYSAADGHFPVPLHPLQRLPSSTRLLEIQARPDPFPGTSGMTTVLARLE